MKLKRYALPVLTIVVGIFTLQNILPWYIMAMICLLVGAKIDLRRAEAFWLCGLTAGFCWVAWSLYSDSTTNFKGSLVIARLLGGNAGWQAHALTALLASVIGGMSGMAGHYLNHLFVNSGNTENATEPRL